MSPLTGHLHIPCGQAVRLVPGSTLSPLGMTSLHSYGAIEIDDDKTPSQEHIALFGKGMLSVGEGVSIVPTLETVWIFDAVFLLIKIMIFINSGRN